MRTIKFRAWVISKATNASWMNYDIEFVGGKINDNFAGRNSKLADITYMQYTGLTDKNGKEIYEKDIVVGQIVAKHKRNAVVDFEDGCFVFREFWKDGLLTVFEEGPNSINFFYNLEVIGNIYENPELLEQSQ